MCVLCVFMGTVCVNCSYHGHVLWMVCMKWVCGVVCYMYSVCVVYVMCVGKIYRM